MNREQFCFFPLFVTTKQYVRTSTATVENQLNVLDSLHHTISVETISFYSFIRSHRCIGGQRKAESAHTRRGFTQTYTAHTNNETIRFGVSTISSHIVRSAFAFSVWNISPTPFIAAVNEIRSSLSIACRRLWIYVSWQRRVHACVGGVFDANKRRVHR